MEDNTKTQEDVGVVETPDAPPKNTLLETAAVVKERIGAEAQRVIDTAAKVGKEAVTAGASVVRALKPDPKPGETAIVEVQTTVETPVKTAMDKGMGFFKQLNSYLSDTVIRLLAVIGGVYALWQLWNLFFVPPKPWYRF